eukprot:COSAG01_NODE_58225_length_307_cov_0.966346_1_plen_33_part_10
MYELTDAGEVAVVTHTSTRCRVLTIPGTRLQPA